MILLVIALLLVSTVISLPAWRLCVRQDKFLWWDYGMPIYPILAWLALVYAGVGAQSLSNAVELLLIGGLVVIVSYMRVFVFNKFLRNGYHISILSNALLLVISALLRMVMPVIPE